MSTFGYLRELEKYEEVDEDDLLATLSSEELQELERELADLDLEENIPSGLKQRDQTTKIPTGTFDRDGLLKYWEDTNKKLEREEVVVSLGQEGHPDKSGHPTTTSEACKTVDGDRKKMSCNGRKARKNDEKEVEVETKSEVKKKDLSRIKFPHLEGPMRAETSQTPSGNPVVIDKALEQVLSNDPTLAELNLNNAENISQCTLLRFAEALSTNDHVHIFSLANTRADDRVAFAIAEMLCRNRFIKTLNIESNFVSGQGVLALLAALQHNSTLEELRFHNQRHICGGKVEMEMVQLLKENTTLMKLGYQFELPGPRMTVTSILTRNQDQQRQKRLQKKSSLQAPTEKSKQAASANQQPAKPSHHAPNQKSDISLSTVNAPARKKVEMDKYHEGSSSTKALLSPRKDKPKLNKGTVERESPDHFGELKNDLKPSLQKSEDEPLQPPQKSTHIALMTAIRESRVSSLKKVDPAQS
ncbi:leiomodin-2a [Cololabis saira]|uniref:leiomodin-2a n=1 Tax=Cololabis saira TaxID=129043 RepID=UPI002AD2FE45|nr:leiomodin-2a [Cololabis saira]